MNNLIAYWFWEATILGLPVAILIVTSPQIPFDEYDTDEIPLDTVIGIMVGNLQRIKIYPDKGFRIFQKIPDDIWRAYEQMVQLGYNQHLA